MANVLKEFRDFITKGNLIEIAVAFIMALAFAAVVASFVADIVTPSSRRSSRSRTSAG
ncbi:MAG TPA: MscL family protein [Acidimicrobiia bacterium]|nr:MscL family protein [Acidimicrobiia bacterium]